MEEKTIEVPEGTGRVTLNIERKVARPDGMTLRQALMATPSERSVVVVVRERAMPHEAGLCWEMPLHSVRGSAACEMDKRAARIARFSECHLCDVGVLLDERAVKRVDIRRHNIDSDCVVFEVENDA